MAGRAWLDVVLITYRGPMARDEGTGRQVSTSDGSVTARVRRARAALEHAATVAMPYGFAAAGLLLGAGGLVTGRELAGACGAVAGVTAGLLERHRAGIFERRGTLLRERLRDQHTEAELEASDLRRQIRELQTALWERDLRDLRAPEPVLGPPSGPIARVIDLTEAREQTAPVATDAPEPARARDGNRVAG
jgi:hypothetical protein